LAACGGIFRNVDFLGAFSVNLGVSTALHPELIAPMVGNGFHASFLGVQIF